MDLESVVSRYRDAVQSVVLREPRGEPSRWRQHTIGARSWQVIQPVTFTPYAAVRPCSGRCLFCSENLREKEAERHASLLRPAGNYFPQLQQVLKELRGLPLSYSLSGLEMTDDRSWFLQLLETLAIHAARGNPVESRVLYSNASGLVVLGDDPVLTRAITDFGFSWIELSRHHYDEKSNQGIMRFRSSSLAADNMAFEKSVALLNGITDIKLVCIVQTDGVDSLAEMLRYLAWARSLGVKHVIFRELSVLDRRYKANATYRYIDSARVSVGRLMQEFLERNGDALPELKQSTYGYYFTNLVVDDGGLRITFESSDYTLLHEKHDSGRVFKLVFHANGNLCADWNPDRHVLFSAAGEGLHSAE
ncbi:hypothetical protein [Microbulbifer taiwanensis]|nr:hypothetical protein [Microbulbifer taiwanensis]